MEESDLRKDFSEMKKLIIDLANSSALASRNIIMQSKCVNSLNLLYFDHLKIFHDDKFDDKFRKTLQESIETLKEVQQGTEKNLKEAERNLKKFNEISSRHS